MIENEEFDFVIIGSGMGGLNCAYILASEGFKVIVLEKNHQLGGNLQVFSRDKRIFDTGVHYIGSLDEGECLDQFFKYFGLRDTLKWKRLDQDCFDMIQFSDGKKYKLGQGYANFKANLESDFPEEVEAIANYCNMLREICKKFPLYNLDDADSDTHMSNLDLLEINAVAYINSLTNNTRLRNVLGGNNGLYAGVASKTPLYVHALITNSYIMGSYRLIDGGSQLAISLSKSIRRMGGKLLKNNKVVSANYHEDGKIKEVVLADGSTCKGKNFISNIHPVPTLEIFGEDRFLKPYTKRIKGLENTASSFIVHLALKENAFKYLNHNIYHHFNEQVWDGNSYTEENWAENLYICTPANSKNPTYADSMAVMAYMRYEDVRQWEETANTVAEPGERGKSYEAFKKDKEAVIIQKLEQIFPGISASILSSYSSTPLTFRDYIGDKEGSMYGILKDSNSPLRSTINTSTKIPNLFLTGQNLIFHGILGATIGSLVTCFNFVDKKKLMQKIKSA